MVAKLLSLGQDLGRDIAREVVVMCVFLAWLHQLDRRIGLGCKEFFEYENG